MNHLLDIAKEVILKGKNKNNSMSFKQIWKNTATKAKIKDIEDEELISDFYMLLLQDPNFIKLPNNEWTLKELHTYSEVEKLTSTICRTEEFEIGENDYHKYMSNYEIDELKKKESNETTSLEIMDLDDDMDDRNHNLTDSISDDDDDFDSLGDDDDK